MINLIRTITTHPRKDFLVVNNLAKWHQLLICTAINWTAINWTGKISNSKKSERKIYGHICHFCPHFSVQIFADMVVFKETDMTIFRRLDPPKSRVYPDLA